MATNRSDIWGDVLVWGSNNEIVPPEYCSHSTGLRFPTARSFRTGGVRHHQNTLFYEPRKHPKESNTKPF
eukprot:2433916-Amphidinium_carterae.1